MRRVVMTAACVLALLATSDARGEEADPRGVGESDRQLAGHLFTPSLLVLAPFSTTAFGTATIFGTGTATGNRFDRQGNVIGTREYDLAAFGQGFDFSSRLTPALAVRAEMLAEFYSGLDGKSILVAGSTAQLAGTLGATLARNFLGGRLRAGLTFDAGIRPEYSLLIANGILRAIQANEIDEATLFRKGSRARIETGTSFAYALSPALGLVAQAAYIWSRRVSGDIERKERNGVAFGAVADLDLDSLSSIPIALLAVYRWEGAGSLPTVQDYGGGIFYSRRVHLQLGLEVVRRRSALRPDIQRLQVDSTIGSLVLRYFW